MFLSVLFLYKKHWYSGGIAVKMRWSYPDMR